MTVYRPFTEKLGGSDPATFVGNYGELFYNAETQQVYISDGVTVGGVPIAGGGGGGGVQSSITDGTSTVSFNVSNEVVMNTDLNVNAINITGHILPTQNAQYDLGSAEYKIRHLFLSDNSLRFGKNGTNDISGEYVSFGKDNLDRNAEVYTDQDGIVPPTPFSIGKKGDIRVFPDFMYVCIRTSEVDDGITVNWVRSSVESGW